MHLTKGTWSADEAVLVRVQSSGTYFDVFSRLSNGEHPLMQKVTDLINAEGKGAVVFINNVSNKENTLSRISIFLISKMELMTSRLLLLISGIMVSEPRF
jgi:3,4-dihydroxy 2-butanone 4-phosphate synthase/GTP cyclohydrolase II